jgi:3-methyladenine DNA glycosylase AlkC
MVEPLKNMYNTTFFEALNRVLVQSYPTFDSRQFLALIYDDEWQMRELKQRVRHITHTLHRLLPSDFSYAVGILQDASSRLSGYTFEAMIFPDFVEVYGLNDWELAMVAMAQFTQQSSAEFAVRPFIMKDQERMMQQMLVWSTHENHHVRRLASEGCRPRLPWAMALPALKANPAPIVPILERLKGDESEYVRRSVANNLNDISKDNPQVVLDMLNHWREKQTPERSRLIYHALRTLVKQGNPEALGIIGYRNTTTLQVDALRVTPERIVMGDEILFSFTLRSTSNLPQDVLIDYILHHQRADGKQTPKVFKLTKKMLAPDEVLFVSKKHSFKPITTRRYYAGGHAVEIQINGASYGKCAFMLDEK